MNVTPKKKLSFRWLRSAGLAWLVTGTLLPIAGVGLYVERESVAQYLDTHATASPHVIVLSSDDWGGLPPRESAADIKALADTLRQCRDSMDRPAVLTAYMIPCEPDLQRMAAQAGQADQAKQADQASHAYSYSCRFAYANQEEITALWRKLVAEGTVEIGFHGRDHWNGPLYLDLLRTQAAYRDAMAQGTIPYRGDAAYDKLLAVDDRMKYLQRSYIDASTSPPHALPLAMQRILTAQGLDELRLHMGVAPAIAVAPGHVWDTVTCQALKAEGIDYLETVPLPVLAPDSDGLLVPTGETAGYFSHPGQINIVVRTDGYEPAWQKAPVSVNKHLWALRQSLACGVPAVVSLHKASFVGPDEAAKAQARSDLRDLLTMARQEFPDLVFLSASDLGRYMYGHGDQANRKVDFARADLNGPEQLTVTIKALWLCHAKFRVFVYVFCASLTWATVVSFMSIRRKKLDVETDKA